MIQRRWDVHISFIHGYTVHIWHSSYNYIVIIVQKWLVYGWYIVHIMHIIHKIDVVEIFHICQVYFLSFCWPEDFAIQKHPQYSRWYPIRVIRSSYGDTRFPAPALIASTRPSPEVLCREVWAPEITSVNHWQNAYLCIERYIVYIYI